jgi:precorrin-3B methylase
LGSLDERKVDMLTVLLVGAKGTRHVARGRLRFVYTPRGYAARGGRR